MTSSCLVVTGFGFQCVSSNVCIALQWRHNGRDSLSNHQPHDCLLNSLFKRRSKKTSKLRVTGLCAGNSPVTGEFPAQMASNAENVSIWWRHHGIARCVAQMNQIDMIVISISSSILSWYFRVDQEVALHFITKKSTSRESVRIPFMQTLLTQCLCPTRPLIWTLL